MIKFTHLIKASALATLGLSLLAFSGCGGDSSSGGGATGPTGFSGGTISLNPVIEFTSDSRLTYKNSADLGIYHQSDFPESPVEADGSYIYSPQGNYTSGSLTITLDDSGISADPIVLNISNFKHDSNGNIIEFQAAYKGKNYPTQVTGGTLAAYVPPPPAGNGNNQNPAEDIPASMQGTYAVTFASSSTPPTSGVPANGAKATLVIAAKTITINGKALSNPFFHNGNTAEWIFQDNGLWWGVSKNAYDEFNEINIMGIGGSPWYGQYRDDNPVDHTPPPLELDEDGLVPPPSDGSGNIPADYQGEYYAPGITKVLNTPQEQPENFPTSFPAFRLTATTIEFHDSEDGEDNRIFTLSALGYDAASNQVTSTWYFKGEDYWIIVQGFGLNGIGIEVTAPEPRVDGKYAYASFFRQGTSNLLRPKSGL